MSVTDEQVLQALLRLASQKSAIPYDDLCQELSLTEEDLEDHLTSIILDGTANIKLDRTNKIVVSRMNPYVHLFHF